MKNILTYKEIVTTLLSLNLIFGIANTSLGNECAEFPNFMESCSARYQIYCDAFPEGCSNDGRGSTWCEISIIEHPGCQSDVGDGKSCPSCAEDVTYEVGAISFYDLPDCTGPAYVQAWGSCGC